MRNDADDRALHEEMNFFGPSTYDKLTERREMTPHEIATVWDTRRPMRFTPEGLPIFHYWFGRRTVKRWVRLRKPGRARHPVVTHFARVDTFQCSHRRNCNHNAEGNSK
jgi:hypothetical protein